MEDINFDGLVSADKLKGEDKEETEQLKNLLNEAKVYIESFNWCPKIDKIYFGLGVGDKLGIFLFKLVKKINKMDDYLWVVVGDLPSAYLVTDDAKDAVSALKIYVKIMYEWCDAVINGNSTDACYPIPVPQDEEHAKMLLSRINFIKDNIIPYFS